MLLKYKISFAILMSTFAFTAYGKQVTEAASVSSVATSVKTIPFAEDVAPAVERKAPSVNEVNKIKNMIRQTKRQVKFPLQIDEDVRWDDMKFDATTNTVTYTYTVTQVSDYFTSGAIENAVMKEMQSQSVEVCTDPLTKVMLKNDVLMSYSYGDRKGRKASFAFDLKSICQ